MDTDEFETWLKGGQSFDSWRWPQLRLCRIRLEAMHQSGAT